MKNLIQNPKVRIAVPPIAGFLAYGAWAFSINFQHGLSAAVMSGLVQGGYSFCITLVLALLVEYLYQRLQPCPGGKVLVFLVAAAFLITTSVGVNLLAGTPELVLTILPGLAVSLGYTGFYIRVLSSVYIKDSKP